MNARLIHEIGTRAKLRVYWGKSCVGSDGAPHGYHNATKKLADSPGIHDWPRGGHKSFVSDSREDYPEADWPTKCDACGAAPDVPIFTGAEGQVYSDCAQRQVFFQALYDTASGSPEAGDVFWRQDWAWEQKDGRGICFHSRFGGQEWPDCGGKHLIAFTPNGWEWDINSRAKNCGTKNDPNHRCWTVVGKIEGDPLDITVNPSIDVPGWHGYLEHGIWRRV